jgi:hypothetical protein
MCPTDQGLRRGNGDRKDDFVIEIDIQVSAPATISDAKPSFSHTGPRSGPASRPGADGGIGIGPGGACRSSRIRL